MTMTPKQFKQAMQKIADEEEDKEDRHRAMDGLMSRMLGELGYKEGCDIFLDTDRWYA